MFYTREMIIKKLKAKVGFYEKDIRTLLLALDDLIEELLAEATDNNDIEIQLIRGIRLSNRIQPEGRQRRDPRDNSPITISAAPKIWAKISSSMKEKMVEEYNSKKKE